MMKRRQFLLTSASLLAGSSILGIPQLAKAQTTSGLDVVTQIKSLCIPSGPYANGYVVAPNGMLNWYFANLGLLPIVQYLTPVDLNTYIFPYLNLYLSNLAANSTISDASFTGGLANPTLVPSDSDDSYAGTFLSLAVRYVRASQNWTWWSANEAALKNIAYRNLAVMQKPIDGLTSTFQPPRNQLNSFGYLMDNCEAYRGLRDFASVLRDLGEAEDANYYDLVATGIVDGISNRLYDTANSGFIASDGATQATLSFYPGTTCQVFPQAYGLTELSAYYDTAWAYLNAHTPNWQNGQYDAFPWAILGYVAAQRGQMAAAQAQMLMIENNFVTNRAAITINELGFYQRTKSLLAGMPSV